MIKNLPAMRETLVRSLGGEDPLEKGILQYSDIQNQLMIDSFRPWDSKYSHDGTVTHYLPFKCSCFNI